MQSDSISGPLFIVGAPRSGTSLLRNLIRACNGVYLPPDETQFIPGLLARLEATRSSEKIARFLERTAFSGNMRRRGLWPTQKELRQLLDSPNPCVMLTALMTFFAEKDGHQSFRIWGDKTPRYVFFLDEFRRFFPGMRVIFVLRDPRDAVLSMRDAWGRSLTRGSIEWRDAALIAQAWLQEQPAADAIMIRYEALVAHPAATMRGIADWLSVEFKHEALEEYIGEERWGAVKEVGVSGTSVGRYRDELAASEIGLIESIALAEMSALGYPPEIADNRYEPAEWKIRYLRIRDSLRSLGRYIWDRGLVRGTGYKISQLLTARLRND